LCSLEASRSDDDGTAAGTLRAMGARFGHGGHLVRMAALFAAGISSFFVLRALFVPEGFGVYGHYRAGAIDDNRAQPLAFAGRAACVECHSDVKDLAKGGGHEAVRCEACHGPLAGHAADPAEKKAVRPDPGILCARCHAANVARPAWMSQVDPAEHSGGEACTTCHAAHHPLPPGAAAPPEPTSEGGPK
jgi:hypothetical protein